MNISRLHVRGFGKIKDFDMSLSKGLNVIYGPNESGKSTLMAFIKAMLYGLKGGRAGKDGRAADNKRYLPWDNNVYGGYMNFELDNGSSYRIDRSFDTGVVRLYDSTFNDITHVYAEGRDKSGIAENLMGINESLFEKTVYIQQLGTRLDGSASKDLIERISNIRQSGWEDISCNRASTALKDALKQQVGTGRSYTRPLDIINNRLEELYAVKNNIQENLKNLWDMKRKQEELDTEIELLTHKEKLFSKVIEFCGLKEKLRHLSEKNDEIRFINDGIRQSQKNIKVISRDKEALEYEARNNKNILKDLLEEQQRQGSSQYEESIDKKRLSIKATDIICFFIIIVLAILAGAAYSFEGIPPQMAGIPVIAGILIWSFLRVKAGRELKKMEGTNSEFKDRGEALGRQTESLQKLETLLAQQLSGISERLKLETEQCEQMIKRLELVSADFNQSDLVKHEQMLDGVSETLTEMSEQTGLTHREREMLECIMESCSENLYKEIIILKNFITDELQQKKIQAAAVENNIKRCEKSCAAEETDIEIQKLTLRKKELEQRGEALSIAIKTLEEAADSVQKKYLPVLNRVFNDIFSGITDRKYTDTRAGDNLSIMLSNTGTETIIPVGSLSSGTIDQLYLALRISVAETVLGINEGLPLIMDEPFSQYDDERTENTLKFFREISKKHQVIIFSCKHREYELIGSLQGANACKICL